MKSKEQVENKIAILKSELETLDAIAAKGFSFPADRKHNVEQRQVRQALIVGLKWVLK